jgi:hypothetical protein
MTSILSFDRQLFEASGLDYWIRGEWEIFPASLENVTTKYREVPGRPSPAKWNVPSMAPITMPE